MKIVINTCFGGFSLSAKAVKRYAELTGKACYFFKTEFSGGESDYVPVPIEDCEKSLFWSAYTIPNPNEVLNKEKKWRSMTDAEKDAYNKLYDDISLEKRLEDRTDPLLIKIVEELGEEANGRCAELKIVEIPDGTDWEIDQYDGLETIDEKHRSWS